MVFRPVISCDGPDGALGSRLPWWIAPFRLRVARSAMERGHEDGEKHYEIKMKRMLGCCR